METRHPGELPVTDGTITVPPSATSPGLLLRPWTEQDVPAMIAAYRDPIMRHWLRRAVTTAEEAHRIIQDRRADRRAGIGFSFAVVRANPDGTAGELLGSVSIRRLKGEAGEVSGVSETGERDKAGEAGERDKAGEAHEPAWGEVGYWVTAPSRGQGIAPRALNAVCDWVFRLPRRRPLEQLRLIHAVGNNASCRVAEKAGFALAAVLPPLPPDFPGDGHLHIRLAGKPPGKPPWNGSR